MSIWLMRLCIDEMNKMHGYVIVYNANEAKTKENNAISLLQTGLDELDETLDASERQKIPNISI